MGHRRGSRRRTRWSTGYGVALVDDADVDGDSVGEGDADEDGAALVDDPDGDGVALVDDVDGDVDGDGDGDGVIVGGRRRRGAR